MESTTEAMASPPTTTRKILKPKSIAQRLKNDQSTTAPSPATPLVAEPQASNQTITPIEENETEIEGLELIYFIISTLNAQTNAYVELKATSTIASTELQGVSEVIKDLYAKLTTAIINHIAAQSGIFLILGLPSSEFTIYNLRRVSAGLREVLPLTHSNIEMVREYVMNVEVMEELQCELKKLKQQCLFGYAERYTEMLEALEQESRAVKREEENQGLVGPRRADFVSLFPSRRGMARLFCGEEEE
jgi:hypothetical protein